MAPSFDYAVSSLLCAEEDSSIFDDVHSFEDVVDDYEICNGQLRNQRNFNQDRNFDGGVGFSGFVPAQMQSDECLDSMFDKECQYLPGFDYLKRLRCGYLDLGVRKEAIDWIETVRSHYDFGPLCLYLSINYLDRFLAAYELPKGNAWMMQLLAVACLSISAKMEETEVPFSLDLQVGEVKYVFEAKAIQRMELLVLSTLKWRMQSVTPFSFIDYFLYKINGDKMPSRSFISQSIQIILGTIKGIDFLEFKPSEIAAAVAFSVTQHETQILEHTNEAFSLRNKHLDKDRVIKCVGMIHDMTLNSRGETGSALTSVPHSPIGVLDAAACLSYKSDGSLTPSGSCVNSTQNSPAPKRRKLDRAILN